jgi:putative ABC transport system permease protein
MLRVLGGVLADLILRGTYATAALLGPFRLGRLLQTVSLPRMREHRLRTTLTVFGIALGVAIVVAVLLVSRSVVSGVTRSIDDLAGKADLQISAGASGLDERVFERVRAVDGVYKSTVALQQIVPIRSDDGRRERLLMVGVDLLGSEDTYFRDYESQELDAIRRDSLMFLNSTTNIILSERVAQRLGVGVHDHVSIATGSGWQRFEVWGLIRGGGVGSAFGGAVGLMYFPAMQVAFERGHNIDRVDVAVRPGRDPEAVAKSLEAALGESYTVERPASRGERVSKLLATLRTGLAIACVIAVIAGAFLVFNTLSISIMQRKREFGTLRALGVKRGDLARLITLEGALLGVVGSALGIVFGLAVSKAMLRQTSDVVDSVWMQQAISDVELDPRLVLLGFTLGLVAATLAALAATRPVVHMQPSEALNMAPLSAAAKPSQGLWRSDLVALALLGFAIGLTSLPPVGKLPVGAIAAAVLLPLIGRMLMSRIVLAARALIMLARRKLGPTAMLASENLPRDLSRSASTASGLMASGALSISLATFVVSFVTSLNAWTAQTVPGDLFVTSGSAVASLSSRNVPMADNLGPALLAIPGVERLRRMRQVTMEYQNANVSVLSTDVREFVKRSQLFPVEGTSDQLRDELLAGSVVVSENFATRFGVHRGDHIVLGTKDVPRSFRVAGVRIDYTSDQGTIFMERETYIANWDDARVDTYEVHLLPGVSAETVRSQINERLSADYDLFVLTNREYRGHFTKQVDHIFGLLRVLEVVTLLVAMLGMLSAIWANVLDRVREIGVLRALGMLRKQVRRLVVLESMFVGVVGGVAGIAVGAAIGYVMLRRIITVQIGWYLPYQLPVSSMLLFLLIALPISALAGFFPAREAARLSVRNALDYE